jgi:zinc transport system ATP-binding protein
VTAASELPAVVSFKGAHFSYDDRPVLTDVNLEIRPEDLVYIVGPNGGGKSTLLKLILGLIRPDRGEVRVFGRPPAEVLDRLGYVPQHATFDLQFPVSVGDVVLMGRAGRRLAGPYRADDREAAKRALADVGLDDFAPRSFSGLSGGERQRVLIARAVASAPELLLLDEPMAHVDYQTSRDIHELLHELESRMHVILVSHHMEMVCGAAKTVITVNRSVEVLPTSEVCANLALIGHDRHLPLGAKQ